MTFFESGCRGTGEVPQGFFKAFFNLPGPSFYHSGSGRPLQHQHLSQVVADPLQPKVIVVAPQAQIATSLQPIAPLQGADNSLHGPAHSRKELIPFLLPFTKGMTTPSPAHDAAEDSFASQRLF